MKKWIFTTILALLAGSVGAVLVYRYAPLNFLGQENKQLFGNTVITTIQGSDTLTASRTTINNNFSSLNTNKFELADWYATTSATQLTTLGTITTGIWHGSTLGTQWGGTGSTSLSTNELFVGNGTGALVSLGWGTTGQILTSQGGGAIPLWGTASFDTTLSYNFTGTDRFKQLISSSTLTFSDSGAGASYVFPTTVGAANACLSDNGSGTLSWQLYCKTTLAVDSSEPTTSSGSTTTLKTVTLAANTLSTTQSIRIYMQGTYISGAGSCAFDAQIGTGGASTSLAYFLVGNAGGYGFTQGVVFATSSSAQSFNFHGEDEVGGIYRVSTFSTYSNTGTLYISFRGRTTSSATCGLSGVTTELLRN